MGSLLLSFTKVRVVLSAVSLKLWIWYDLLPFEMEQLRAAQMPALTQDRCFKKCFQIVTARNMAHTAHTYLCAGSSKPTKHGSSYFAEQSTEFLLVNRSD